MGFTRYINIYSIFIAAAVFFIFGTNVYAAEQKVAYVVVEGNQQASEEEILGEITRFIQAGDALDSDKINSAIKAVEDLGYFSNVTVDMQPSFMGFKLVFKVTENPPLKEIKINGLTKIKPEDIISLLSLKPGQVINTTTLNKDFYGTVMGKIIRTKGVYLISKDLKVEPDGVINWEITEAKLLDIKIEGLKMTKDVTVRRMLKSKIGELYDHNMIINDYQTLLKSKLFESINLDLENPDLEKNGVVVVFTCKEDKPIYLETSISIDEYKNITGALSLKHNNLFGYGNILSLDWEASNNKDNYSFSLTAPWLNNSGTSLGIMLYNTTLKGMYYNNWDILDGEYFLFRDRYDEKRKGGQLRLTQPLNDHWQTYMNYKNETYKEIPNDKYLGSYDRPLADPSSHHIDSLGLGLEFNTITLKNPFYVDKGTSVDLSTEFAGNDTPIGLNLGGDINYQRYSVNVRQYFSLGENQTLAMRLIGGTILNDTQHINSFTLGGSESLRGYYPRSYNGDQMLLGNVEYRYQFDVTHKSGEEVSYKPFEAVAFYDIGQTWGGTTPTNGYKYSYGVGMRFMTPLGQLRLDYAWSKDNPATFTFSIGEMF